MEFLSLTGDVTRARALEGFLTDSVSDEEDSELCIHTTSVDKVDVVTATAARMRIARHLREHVRGRVSIVLPGRNLVAARLHEMLSPLPSNVVAANVPGTDSRTNYVLVPATLVSDTEDVTLLGEFALDMCSHARISRRRGGFITQTVMELADNALRHGKGATDQPVLAVTSVGRERLVEIAVTDAGAALSEADDPPSEVRAIPGKAIGGHPGFLGQILQHGQRAGVDVRVEVMAGTARLLWTASRHRTERRSYVPGTTVVARIGA